MYDGSIEDEQERMKKVKQRKREKAERIAKRRQYEEQLRAKKSRSPPPPEYNMDIANVSGSKFHDAKKSKFKRKQAPKV